MHYEQAERKGISSTASTGVTSLKHVNLSIKHLRQGKPSNEVVLVTSLLFWIRDFHSEQFDTALMHILSSLRLIGELRANPSSYTATVAMIIGFVEPMCTTCLRYAQIQIKKPKRILSRPSHGHPMLYKTSGASNLCEGIRYLSSAINSLNSAMMSWPPNQTQTRVFLAIFATEVEALLTHYPRPHDPGDERPQAQRYHQVRYVL